jgi:Helix-hairpin-helix motif
MDSRFRWVCIGALLFLLMGGPFKVLAFLGHLGLAPRVTQEQVVAEMKRMRHHDWMTCKPASPGAEWDYVCEYGGPGVSREAVRTNKGWGAAIARVIVLPLEREVLTEADAAKWRLEEHRKLSEAVNIRTASVSDLQRIPRVDQYRAQEIHAAVRAGLVRNFDDLLKIQGIDQQTLKAMRTRAYWK